MYVGDFGARGRQILANKVHLLRDQGLDFLGEQVFSQATLTNDSNQGLDAKKVLKNPFLLWKKLGLFHLQLLKHILSKNASLERLERHTPASPLKAPASPLSACVAVKSCVAVKRLHRR